MAKMQMIKIDGEKLKEQLKAQCFTLEAASLRMGRSAGYIKQIVTKGEMPTHTMRHIMNEFNIKIEDIQPDPQPEPEPQAQDEGPQQMSIRELMVCARTSRGRRKRRTDRGWRPWSRRLTKISCQSGRLLRP